ncbi:type III pantothenate kinase [bacterium]|nr:type III pantothenate kinase [bacterium]
MLLVVDVGNTNTVLGVYRADKLLGQWRLTTAIHRTADEYAILFDALLRMKRIERSEIKAAIISCVVPPILPFLEELFSKEFAVKPLLVGPGIKTGIAIMIENPKEVGADRIVNAVAAYEMFRQQCIIIDFGTATTFDVVSDKAEYLGGLIFPGITISAEALFLRAAKLPRIEITRPPAIIGKNTIHSIQSGIYYGYCEMVDGLIGRIRATLPGKTRVIATGGYADLLGKEAQSIDDIVPQLTLEGLRIIYSMNRS